MTAAHTPGPWQLVRHDPSKHSRRVGRRVTWTAMAAQPGGGRSVVAEFKNPFGSHTPDELEANARLATAAPDLLRACQAAATALLPGTPGIARLVHDAIARATEDQP